MDIILLAITTFAITNIDDLLLLSFYFSNKNQKKLNIIAGQYIGVYALVLISLSGFLLGKVIEEKYIGLLGLVPVYLGLKILLSKKDEGNDEEKKVSNSVFSIAAITIANGGDNIGVYTPIFATADILSITIFILVFSVMIAVWCLFAYYLTNHPLLKSHIEKYGSKILPYFLIILGLWIVYGSGVFGNII